MFLIFYRLILLELANYGLKKCIKHRVKFCYYWKVKMAKKGYGYFYFIDENGTLQMRKLTGGKQKEVLINYLRRRSGREMKIETIANAFNVSTRSIQKLLKELETENVIRREATYDENGKRKANRIVYIGDKSRLTGNEPQIENVCAVDNPLKLRDFRWEGYWRLDNDKVFFNYEDYCGCDGTIPELNARARRNGCTSVFEDPEEFYNASEYVDEKAEAINKELKSFAKKKRKKRKK